MRLSVRRVSVARRRVGPLVAHRLDRLMTTPLPIGSARTDPRTCRAKSTLKPRAAGALVHSDEKSSRVARLDGPVRSPEGSRWSSRHPRGQGGQDRTGSRPTAEASHGCIGWSPPRDLEPDHHGENVTPGRGAAAALYQAVLLLRVATSLVSTVQRLDARTWVYSAASHRSARLIRARSCLLPTLPRRHRACHCRGWARSTRSPAAGPPSDR